MTDYDPENIFAKILEGTIPCNEVDQDETTLSFEDINPQAPVHSLVIPKGSYTDLSDFAARASDAEIAGWVRALARVAARKGVDGEGYRVIMNCGANAHQEVPHLHGHVLGGQPLGPMLSRKG
ncbi:MAG: histidine triad nucleotide-binding protein [Candidatus Puniceispirillales bacterium]